MTETADAPAACTGSLLVTVPKAGTHLMLKLYARAGYLNAGWGAVERADLRTPREEMERALFQSPPVFAIAQKHWHLRPDVILDLVLHHARSEAGDPGSRLPRVGDPRNPEIQAAWRDVQRLNDTTLFSPRFVVSVHQFSWITGRRLLEGWGRTGVPGIVYCYRDPRAQLVSMVRFLASGSIMPDHPWALVYRPIFQSMDSMDQMLSFAISERALPFREAYRENRWLLYHPQVLKVRFEDLVGEEGGGSRERQAEAVARWVEFLSIDVPAPELAQGLFGGTSTFSKGRVDSWRNVFQEHHLKAFEREFGDVLADYGYAER